MRDVTPQSNWAILIKSIGLAIGTAAILALMKIAFRAFLSVSGYIIPLALVYFLVLKYGNKEK